MVARDKLHILFTDIYSRIHHAKGILGQEGVRVLTTYNGDIHMKGKIAILVLMLLFLTIVPIERPAGALATDDYVAYVRLKSYPNLETCALTDGIGQCLSPVKDNFDVVGVIEIEESYNVWRVEVYGRGIQKPVTLTVNGILKEASCFRDSFPDCHETLTYDISATKQVKIFSSEYSSISRHGFELQWIKLYIYKSTQATVDIEPSSLNLRSGGMFITAYIELEDADVRDINASTVLLNNAIRPILDEKYGFVTSEDSYITDHDEDGELERMLKFWRSEVEEMLDPSNNVSLTITGNLFDGVRFEGTDTIRTLVPQAMLHVGPGTIALDTEDYVGGETDAESTEQQRNAISLQRSLQVY